MGAGWINRLLKQQVTYWKPAATLGGDGNPDFGVSTEMMCRWEKTQELFVTQTGEQLLSRSVMFVSDLTTLQVDGRVFLGPKASAPTGTPADPTLAPEILRIAAIEEVPAIKGTMKLRKAWLR